MPMTAAISVFIFIYLFSGIIYFGLKKKRYNHIKDTISELGEYGSPYQKAVSYGLFLPIGLLLFIIAYITPNDVLKGLSFCLGVGYILSAFFPCDVGAPIKGSARQLVHNFAGIIEYGGGFFFLLKAVQKRIYFFAADYQIIAITVLIGIVSISIPANPVRGLMQRITELLLFGSVIYFSMM